MSTIQQMDFVGSLIFGPPRLATEYYIPAPPPFITACAFFSAEYDESFDPVSSRGSLSVPQAHHLLAHCGEKLIHRCNARLSSNGSLRESTSKLSHARWRRALVWRYRRLRDLGFIATACHRRATLLGIVALSHAPQISTRLGCSRILGVTVNSSGACLHLRVPSVAEVDMSASRKHVVTQHVWLEPKRVKIYIAALHMLFMRGRWWGAGE